MVIGWYHVVDLETFARSRRFAGGGIMTAEACEAQDGVTTYNIYGR